jgi:NitT/TauT family transport system permease protein
MAIQRVPGAAALDERAAWGRSGLGLGPALASVASPLVLVAVWELAYRVGWLTDTTFTSPTAVLAAFVEIVRGTNAGLFGAFSTHVLTSLGEIVVGFAISVGVAVPLGVAMGWNRVVDNLLDPIVGLIRPIPPLAWVPISMLLFDVGFGQKVFSIVIASFAPVLINTANGTKKIDAINLKVARTHNASERDVVVKVLIPAVTPVIMVSMRIGLGLAWMALIGAEIVAANAGLGYLLFQAFRLFRVDLMLATMIFVGVLAFGMDQGLRAIERRRLRWME